MAPILPASSGESNVLDFDVETIAAGFADPNWVPQKITCVAWSWLGSEFVHSRVCGPEGLFGRPELRREMLEPLLKEIAKADMVIGHNIGRFDLPVVNADAMRLGLPPVRRVLIHDTMKILRSKGFKKGQDTLGKLFKTRGEKLPLDWQAWQDAYDEPGWPTIIQRAETDVIQHKELYRIMLAERILKPPSWWKA